MALTPRCWIITNRRVTPQGRVDEDCHDPLPVFRVGSFKPANPKSRRRTQAELRDAVTFYPDVDVLPGYGGLTPRTDPSTLPGTQRLFAEVYRAMLEAPQGKGDTLFFLHGFNYSWADSLEHLQRLMELYVLPAHSPVLNIVYFSWPSRGSYFKYPADRETSWLSGELLRRVFLKAMHFYADFFRAGKAPFCGRRIHIAAHSMGNRVLENFIGGQLYQDSWFPLFGEVLLLNADLDWQALNPERPLYRLPQLADRIHVYNHKSDDAVLLSESLKNHDKRLGKHGPESLSLLPPRTVVVDCTHSNADALEAETTLGLAERLMNAPRKQSKYTPTGIPLKERVVDHWGYLFRPTVIEDVIQVLSGTPSSEIKGRTAKNDRLYVLK
ncbi:MAG: alpha/beta hydrolase [Candidatus Sumerlaeia bacterium]|nr:alpha/beta hydrolase [Candidatus Sumerlaeia bacterium]